MVVYAADMVLQGHKKLALANSLPASTSNQNALDVETATLGLSPRVGGGSLQSLRSFIASPRLYSAHSVHGSEAMLPPDHVFTPVNSSLRNGMCL